MHSQKMQHFKLNVSIKSKWHESLPIILRQTKAFIYPVALVRIASSATSSCANQFCGTITTGSGVPPTARLWTRVLRRSKKREKTLALWTLLKEPKKEQFKPQLKGLCVCVWRGRLLDRNTKAPSEKNAFQRLAGRVGWEVLFLLLCSFKIINCLDLTYHLNHFIATSVITSVENWSLL